MLREVGIVSERTEQFRWRRRIASLAGDVAQLDNGIESLDRLL
jgi:hypothetical protein